MKNDRLPQCLYRYTGYVDPESLNCTLECTKYPIIKYTKCGYWIRYDAVSKGRKLVMSEGRNIFARTSKMEALKSFVKRKGSQMFYLEWDLKATNLKLLKAQELILSMEKECSSTEVKDGAE